MPLSAVLVVTLTSLANMDSFDPSTIASIIACIVAGAALLIAGAQVAQQYISSGPLIRLCDSYVFGPMPGGGRRVWSLRQFRFRIIYEIPQIKLPSDWWPTDVDTDLSDSARRRHRRLPWFYDFTDNGDTAGPAKRLLQRQTSFKVRADARRWVRVASAPFNFLCRLSLRKQNDTPKDRGSSTRDYDDNFDDDLERSNPDENACEACWVALGRMAQLRCDLRLEYVMVSGDADRCPADVQVVPMLVSLRDIVALCFMFGMTLVNVDHSRNTVHMKGDSGLLMSSTHPLLGVVVRFVPRVPYLRNMLAYNAAGHYIWLWFRRMCGYVIIGDTAYTRNHLWQAQIEYRTKVKKALMRAPALPKFSRGDDPNMEPSTPVENPRFHINQASPSPIPLRVLDIQAHESSDTEEKMRDSADQGLSMLGDNSHDLAGTRDQENEYSNSTGSETERKSNSTSLSKENTNKSLVLYGTNRAPRMRSKSFRRASTSIAFGQRRQSERTRDIEKARDDYDGIIGPYKPVHRRYAALRERINLTRRELRLSREVIESIERKYEGCVALREDITSEIGEGDMQEESFEDSLKHKASLDMIKGQEKELKLQVASLWLTLAENKLHAAYESGSRAASPRPDRPRDQKSTGDDPEIHKESDRSKDRQQHSRRGSWERRRPGGPRIRSTSPEKGSPIYPPPDIPLLDSTSEDYYPRTERFDHESPGNSAHQHPDSASSRDRSVSPQRHSAAKDRTHTKSTSSTRAQRSVQPRTDRESRRAKHSRHSRRPYPPPPPHRLPPPAPPHLQRHPHPPLVMTSKHLELPWYWYAQMTTLPGFWVNMWPNKRAETDTFLHRANALFRETLKLMTESTTLQYVPWTHEIYRTAQDLITKGETTHPPFNHSVEKGEEPLITGVKVKFSAFNDQPVMPIFFLEHNMFHNRSPGGLNSFRNDQDICELMVLDCWLTHASHQHEIRSGKAALSMHAPHFVDDILLAEEHRIEAMTWSTGDDGLQELEEGGKRVNDRIMRNLKLNEAEHLFLLVTIYRTIRTAHCLLHGPDSSQVAGILRTNPAVHLA